jgi:hypothetical protein
MLRARRSIVLHTVFGLILAAGPARAQNAQHPGAVGEMPLPGGLRGALAAIDDGAAADRSQFLLEFIRRTYDTPIIAKGDPRELRRRLLLAHLTRHQTGVPTGAPETVPLPLPAAIWTDVVFGGRATSHGLAVQILESRSAALLYHGLLSLDDGARAWLATQPDLVAELASQHYGALLVAAPGLRVADAVVRVPGGELAEPVWQALVGRPANEPAGFVRALLTQGEGRLAYFFGAIAQLTPAQIRLALNLDVPDVAGRVAAARRLYAVFAGLAPEWKIEDRAFWRPALDPALLVADLRVDDGGRPVVPGTRPFWSAVFARSDERRSSNDDPRPLSDGDPVDLVWLSEEVFKGGHGEQRRRYRLVLFASRHVRLLTPETAKDGVDAVRAAGAYPALVGVLERAKLADVAAFASAGRRAALLSGIGDHNRALRALAQFQGTLALVTRAALRGSLPADSLSSVVSSLSAVDFSERGDYEGRLVRWLAAWIDGARQARGSGEMSDLDQAGLDLLAGPAVVEPRFVDWEGTRYRLDLAGAEAVRLARVLGEHSRPYLSSAKTLVGLADALGEAGLTLERLRRQAGLLEQVAQAVAWEGMHDSGTTRAVPAAGDWEGTGILDRYREAAAALNRVTRDRDVRGASRLAPALLVLADDLFARGLVQLAYAVALGNHDHAAMFVGEAASRHDFGLRGDGGRIRAWQLPVAGSDITPRRGWHVTGSLLGLDVKLAELSLVRLSSKLPARKPSLTDVNRRVLIEAVALVEPASLTDGARDTLVEAIRKGRARLAAARTPAEALAIADEIRLGPARRSLFAWVVGHQPERAALFLSPLELLWLGFESRPIAAGLHAWGAPAEPRAGCLCLELIDRRQLEALEGRWNFGLLASAFPDLNLRLTELLAELNMPAQLLGPILTSATLDFIETATSRDQDDRRGLVEFVQALRLERVEQYLALLTTDGPLVPVGSDPEPGGNGDSRLLPVKIALPGGSSHFTPEVSR